MKLLTTALLTGMLAAAAFGAAFSGTVKQTMNSGGYTYALIATGSGDVWVAGPETKVTKGQKISTGEGMLMSGFKAKSLNRTFDQIYFVNSIGGGGKSADAGAGSHGGGSMANPHAGMPLAGSTAPAPAAAKPKAGTIKKATHTVADLFFQPRLLKGKTVEVRGLVTKYNEGIMGSNWIHLMDGSGTPGKDDLVITTKQSCKVGDKVVVKGTVGVDRDLGSGYFFPVLVENATVKVEPKGKGK
jgi:hypothetical protein